MEKEHTYIVEVIFEAVTTTAEETPKQVLELHTEVATFKDFNKSQAKRRAQDFFDKTLRYGLSKRGKSVVKAVVPPNCIKNIALVDMELFEQEMSDLQEAREAEINEEATS